MDSTLRSQRLLGPDNLNIQQILQNIKCLWEEPEYLSYFKINSDKCKADEYIWDLEQKLQLED